MKLATFIAPGETDRPGGRSARRRDRRLHAPEPCSTASDPATARPPTAQRHALDRRHAARARPAPARDLLHRAQLRRPHRRARLREAREAARLPQAAAVERPAAGPGQAPEGHAGARLRGRAGARDGSGATRSRATRSPTTSPPATCSAPRPSGHAPRASTPRCPWGPWITTADEIDPSSLRLTTHVNGELRQDGSTSDLIFKPRGARRVHQRGLHARARRDHPHRHAERRRRGLQAAQVPAAGRHRAGGGRGPGGPRAPDHGLVRVDHAVDQAVLGGLIGLEEAVALHVACGPPPRAGPCAWRRSRRCACAS